MKKLFVFIFVLILSSPLGATSILMDQIHGTDQIRDLYGNENYGLERLIPDADYVYLTKGDLPIENVIVSGSWIDDTSTLTFTVPENAEMLYGRFEFSNMLYNQNPYITVVDSDGEHVASQFNGSFHVESPEPGDYTITYYSSGAAETHYEIGTGPLFFISELLTDHDIMVRLCDETWTMFYGGDQPEYSDTEQNIIDHYIMSGGNFLFMKEPAYAMIDKPVIRLYSPVDITAGIKIDFPGAATYAEPLCETLPSSYGTLYDWSSMQVKGGEMSEILYEGKPYQPIDWLALSVSEETATGYNRVDYPLRDVIVYRYNSSRDVAIFNLGEILPHEPISAAHPCHLSRDDATNYLNSVMHTGGLQSGLFESEMTSFLNQYRWMERALDKAARSHTWQAIFRFDTAAYNALLPLQCDPPPGENVRTMWFILSDIPEDWPLDQTPANFTPDSGASWSTNNSFVYHEYGVIEQPYPHQGGNVPRDVDFYGWTLHDEDLIYDPTNYGESTEQPIFHTWGSSEIATEISLGVNQVMGWIAGSMIIPDADDILLRGDDDASSFYFSYGEYPPVAAAKLHGQGHLAAIHDVHILQDVYDNRQFINNIVGWMDETFDVEDDPAEAKNWLGQNYPNPFNPSTTIAFRNKTAGQVSLKIFNAAGQFVESLVNAQLAAGEHSVTWDAKDRPSGVYHYRLETRDYSQTRELMLLK